MSHLSRQYVNHYYWETPRGLKKDFWLKPSEYAKAMKMPITGFEPNGVFPITSHDRIGYRKKKKSNTTKRRMKRIRKHAF